MPIFKILPVLGLKVDVPADDPSLLQFLGENVARTHDTNGQNVDYQRKENACSKAYGYDQWANSAISTPVSCHGLYELDDGVNRDNLIFDTGRIFYYDSNKDPQQLDIKYLDYSNLAVGGGDGTVAAGDTVTGDSTGTQATVVTGTTSAAGTLYISNITGGTGNFSAAESLTFSGGETADCDSVIQTSSFNSTLGYLYSAITYGSYIIVCDGDTGQPPFKWLNGDAELTNLITATDGTQYKARYFLEYQRRILMAYTNQTNGDLELRWTDALPTMTNLEFAAANQAYKPGVDPITGMAKFGAAKAILYGDESINRIDYYPDYTAPFAMVPLVQGQGCHSHHSIVNFQGANWFFNKNYGFVKFMGNTQILKDDIISRDLDELIATIDPRYYDRIIGRPLPLQHSIAWAVPLDGATTPSHIMVYHIPTKAWAREVKPCHAIDAWTLTTGTPRKLVYALSDGLAYSRSTDQLGSAGAFESYRIEPMLDFGTRDRMKFISEIWFDVAIGAGKVIDVYHRSGDTVDEVLEKSWTSIGTVECVQDARFKPALYTNLSGRLHQLKWGSDYSGEKYSVNGISFRYAMQGRR